MWVASVLDVVHPEGKGKGKRYTWTIWSYQLSSGVYATGSCDYKLYTSTN